MPAGYSSNPLYKKLGMKEGLLVKIINEPLNYSSLIGDAINKIEIVKSNKNIDIIHLFINTAQKLEKQLPMLMKQIKRNGVIWVSWYKKSSKRPTELTDDIIRNTALALGIVDVKVCAVDEEWSGVKLVYRIENR